MVDTGGFSVAVSYGRDSNISSLSNDVGEKTSIISSFKGPKIK